MIRSLTLFMVLMPVSGFGSPLEALDRGGEAPIVLEAEEFRFLGFDAQRDLIALRTLPALPATEARPRNLKVVEARRAMLLQVPATQVGLLVEAKRAGQATLKLQVRCADEPAVGARCTRVRVQTLSVWAGEAQLAERDLRKPLVLPRVAAMVEVRLPGHRAVRELAQGVGRDCLLRALDGTRMISGALQVELRASPVGRPERPRIVIDSLVNKTLSHCLVQRLLEERGVWIGIAPGARRYMPFYFRGGPAPPAASEEGSSDWLFSGSKAP